MQMTTDTIRKEEETIASVSTSTTETLAAIVTTVKRDCVQAAKAYLEETKVPHGGE
jgi:hypothetical protein